MKTIINLLIILIFSFILCCETKASDLWLENIPVKELKNLFQKIGYEGEKGYLMLDTHTYPRIFLKNFPPDFNTITDEKEKTTLFIKIIAPLVLKANEEITKERSQINNIKSKFTKGEKLSEKDIEIIENKATKYDIFTRLKSNERYNCLLNDLTERIDIIPPSILITAAAIETNWGSSRIVKDGNSLYKALNWYSDEGLKPIGETSDDSYRIKTYPNIYESIKEFALTLNSDIDFSDFRKFRKSQRYINPLITGTMLAPRIFLASNLQNYAGLFDYTLNYYELLEIDKSKLADKIISEEIFQPLNQYRSKN